MAAAKAFVTSIVQVDYLLEATKHKSVITFAAFVVPDAGQTLNCSPQVKIEMGVDNATQIETKIKNEIIAYAASQGHTVSGDAVMIGQVKVF